MAKKEKKKMGKIEIAFTIFSLIFLIGFSCFYGYRMFYYKNKLAPKNSDGKEIVLLSNKLKENTVSTGDGLYDDNSIYVYKGKEVNNYIKLSNMLFRIVKINKDNTIEIVLDQEINKLMYDQEKLDYKESDLNKYLNDIFYNNIKNDSLIKGTYCTDKITDANKITCNEIETDYVKLLSISDYLNSKNNNESYLNNNQKTWLINNNEENIWIVNNGELSLSKPSELQKVKPVLTLDNLTEFNEGNGSIENPYTIKKDESYFASYIKIDNDLYRVSNQKEKVLKLQAENIYNEGNTKYHFSNKINIYSIEDGIGKYLNETIYNELSYKDILIDCETYVGNYTSYEEVMKNKVTNKIGIQSIIEPIFNEEKNNYYFSTPFENENVYIYNEEIYPVKPNIIRNINLSVCVDKNKIKDGKGTKDNPYIIESEVQE